MNYCISRCEGARSCGNNWDGAYWRDVPQLSINHFHSRTGDHRPVVYARLAHDSEGIAVCFRVEDCYVLSRRTEFLSQVCDDSCVEFFFHPGGADGYFNFEVNCGGTLHASYILYNNVCPEGGFHSRTMLTPEDGERTLIYTSLPRVIEQEITTPLTWCLGMFIPLPVLEHYCGEAAYSKEGWTGNLYKCAEQSSHPHWAAWQAVEPLNFHQPRFFGEITFA